jgi:hypothetical protein
VVDGPADLKPENRAQLGHLTCQGLIELFAPVFILDSRNLTFEIWGVTFGDLGLVCKRALDGSTY